LRGTPREGANAFPVVEGLLLLLLLLLRGVVNTWQGRAEPLPLCGPADSSHEGTIREDTCAQTPKFNVQYTVVNDKIGPVRGRVHAI
jgi:hypothetical protein